MTKRRPLRDLDPTIKAELDRLLTDGKHTIRQVTQHLQQLGASVSKSAVHRYSVDFEHAAESVRYAREMAVALGKEVGASLNSDTGRVTIELLHGQLLKLIVQLSREDSVDPEAMLRLARSIHELEISTKLNTDTVFKVRAQALKDAANAAEEAATAEGLSNSTIDAIKARILGVKDAA